MSDLKPGWQRVKFGEVVRQVKDKVDPETSGLKRFVAGEHMDTDNLRIRSWGDIGDGYLGPAFHMRFRPGQVLYGSRRTYLRKVAVADFEGICANTTFILETANSNELLPEFLPYIMTAEAFHEHSRRESKGSVNPYVNFSDLAWYEFALPPLEEQRRMVAMLIAWDKLSASYADSLVVGVRAQAAMLRHFFEKRGDEMPLSMFCRNLITYGIVQAGPDVANGVPYIRVTDMAEGELKLDNLQRTAPEIAAKYKRSELDEGDLVLALRGPIGLAVTLPANLRGANLTQGTARVSVRREWSTDYVRWALRSPPIQARINSVAKGSTFKEISLAALRDLPIPWVAPQRQYEVAEALNAVDMSLRHLSERKDQAKVRIKAAFGLVLDVGEET